MRIELDGVSLAYQRYAPDANGSADVAVGEGRASPTVVMLHEGLGSIGQWRDLPEQIAKRSGLEVIAYERSGYGRSSPVPVSYGADFMDYEACEVLPKVLQQLDVKNVVLLGHSDGATIALIAAAADSAADSAAAATDSANSAVRGVIALAPHTFVEEISLSAITAIGAQQNLSTRADLIKALARHHDHAEMMFDRWRNVWLSAEFRNWSMVDQLPNIKCPVLVLQGDRDEYGTAAQVSTITKAVPSAVGHLIDDCGHSPHRDRPAEVITRIGDFLADI